MGFFQNYLQKLYLPLNLIFQKQNTKIGLNIFTLVVLIPNGKN